MNQKLKEIDKLKIEVYSFLNGNDGGEDHFECLSDEDEANIIGWVISAYKIGLNETAKQHAIEFMTWFNSHKEYITLREVKYKDLGPEELYAQYIKTNSNENLSNP